MKVRIGNLLGAMYHSPYMLSQQPSEVGTVPFMGGKQARELYKLAHVCSLTVADPGFRVRLSGLIF